MSKKFKTNVTYSMIFKKLLNRGEKNIRMIITAAESTSYAVYLAFLEAIKSSVIASDSMIEALDMQIYTTQNNNVINLRMENVSTLKLDEYLKPILNFAVALKVSIYRKGNKLTWIIVNGAAHKNQDIGRVRIDYESYAEVLDRFLRCRESKNIKCTILDEKKLSKDDKIKSIEELITAGILNQTNPYLNVRITYINGMYQKEIQTKNYGELTGEGIREKIHEIISNERNICFMCISVVTTRKKSLEWAICY